MKKLFILLFFTPILLAAQPAIQWQKTYGGNDSDEVYSIKETSEGGYIVAGQTVSTSGDVFNNHGGRDFWVLKLTISGGIVWKKTFGGTDNEWPHAVFQTSDGGYFVGGSARSNDGNVTGAHGESDYWALKLSSTGAIQWQKTFGGTGSDVLTSAVQTLDGGYIVGGVSSSTDGDITGHFGLDDSWVVKINATGDIEWQKSLGGSDYEYLRSIIQTSDGGYLAVSDAYSSDGDISSNHGFGDIWAVKLTASGEIAWEKTFGGDASDFPSDVIETLDGGYAVSGYTGSYNTGDVTGQQGGLDYWILKLDNLGELEWQKTVGGSDLEWARAIKQLSNGALLIAGTTVSSDGDVIGNDGGGEFWLVKLDLAGQLVWQQTYGGSLGEMCNAMDLTSDNGIVLGGYTWSTDGDVAGSANKGYDDFWVVKLAPEQMSATVTLENNELSLTPNPTSQMLDIQLFSKELLKNIVVYDQLGHIVLQLDAATTRQVDVSALPPGMYLLAGCSETGKRFAGRFCKK